MSNYGPMGPPVQAQPQMMAGPPKKKGLSTGCLVVICLVLFFFVAVGGIVFFIGYKISTDKDVQNVMGAIGDAAKIMAEAQQAPGTNELRGLGCEQAMALDATKMQQLGDKFMDAGTPSPSPEVERIVTCQVQYAKPPSCDDAAKAYIRGAAPTKKFMLMVQAAGGQQCGGIYLPSGALESPMPHGRGATTP